jgi:hypothetical protein
MKKTKAKKAATVKTAHVELHRLFYTKLFWSALEACDHNSEWRNIKIDELSFPIHDIFSAMEEELCRLKKMP